MKKSCRKPMYLFLETIRIEAGEPCLLPLHQERVEQTLAACCPGASVPLLAEVLCNRPILPDTVKARVVYGAAGIVSTEYAPYTPRIVRSLCTVEAPDGLNYRYKQADRTALNELAAQRGEADEVLIVRQGLLTDTSYSNIALYDGHRWLTPARPLLCGVMRRHLLEQGVLAEADIPAAHLHSYSHVALINAMLPLGCCVVEL